MSRKGYWIPLCGLPTLRENKKKSSAAEDRIRCLTRKKIIVRRGGQRRKGYWIPLCGFPALREKKKMPFLSLSWFTKKWPKEKILKKMS
jgi:hypothetical protein